VLLCFLALAQGVSMVSAAPATGDVQELDLGASDPLFPAFHLRPQTNWNNDPNGKLHARVSLKSFCSRIPALVKQLCPSKFLSHHVFHLRRHVLLRRHVSLLHAIQSGSSGVGKHELVSAMLSIKRLLTAVWFDFGFSLPLSCHLTSRNSSP
jgi:hypothetical protein